MTTRRTDETFLADRTAQEWANRLIRTSAVAPSDIDAVLASASLQADRRGKVVFPDADDLPVIKAPATQARPVIGVLLDDANKRTADGEASALAARYAALAVEKECEVVIFSHQHNAGFERFGFRVERIAGKTKGQRAACIAQLKRFWGIDVLI